MPLIQTIYAIVEALFPVVAAARRTAARRTAARPDASRAGVASRLQMVIFHLLALTARMQPRRAARTTPAANRPAMTPKPQPTPSPPRPPRSTLHRVNRRPLSPRQLAACLAALLDEIEAIIAELGHSLPELLAALCTQARALAGCPPQPATTLEL